MPDPSSKRSDGKKSFYELLGVEKSATQDQIKRGYRNEALKWHPDKNSDPKASARFRQVANAYEVLSDPRTRRVYDVGGYDSHGGGSTDGYDPFSRANYSRWSREYDADWMDGGFGDFDGGFDSFGGGPFGGRGGFFGGFQAPPFDPFAGDDSGPSSPPPFFPPNFGGFRRHDRFKTSADPLGREDKTPEMKFDPFGTSGGGRRSRSDSDQVPRPKASSSGTTPKSSGDKGTSAKGERESDRGSGTQPGGPEARSAGSDTSSSKTTGGSENETSKPSAGGEDIKPNASKIKPKLKMSRI
ncbi:DnaJ-domain-containing protein [Gonapodya prolifera JEL478]|uniref:DnaJ-domain-containing protein n=1 Tax=Gonapodya prolifera (strain JEL478) TaxID=1344416 RepID=A0A139AG54_GONPJ|nr:DnaJ-domain-containing protein [Gonapodya prolifera JEL478]|eukprot:KXS15415.1 DnaJ-domain-containing protein [Gonapodya prolifera JEL478]